MDPRSHHPDRPLRQSLRLSNHDYASIGAYYVTICAEQREPLFDIPELWTILTDTWHTLPRRFPTITLDAFVIMPDHIHCLLWLAKDTPNAPTLGKVIGAYKSLTTVAWLRHIEATNKNSTGRFWQRNYYEHIIRDNTELEEIRHYICSNPVKPYKPRSEWMP